MSTYIGFSVNSNRQIEHFERIEKGYSLSSSIGEFFVRQAKQALEGAYVPKEDVYCMPCEDASNNKCIERFIKDTVRNGRLPYVEHFQFPLRDIAFVYEKMSGYENHRIENIQRNLQKIKADPKQKRELNAYRSFHQAKEKDLYNRVITAVGTSQGILLFNDTARGIQYAQKYLQHVGDNFFSPVYKDADKLQIYYFSTSNVALIKEAQKCSNMFEHNPYKTFIPSKTHFLDPNIMANYPPKAEYSMNPTLECYNDLVDRLNLRTHSLNYNIGMLDRIYKTGKIGNLKDDIRFKHKNSFASLDERIQKSYVGRQDDTLLRNSLQRTVRDTAKRILQTQYEARGYESPKQEKKKKTNNKINL